MAAVDEHATWMDSVWCSRVYYLPLILMWVASRINRILFKVMVVWLPICCMINDSLMSFLVYPLDDDSVMVVFSSSVSFSFTTVHLLIFFTQSVVGGW